MALVKLQLSLNLQKISRSWKKVLLIAGDTFRAAAVEQLQVWADRLNCQLVRGPEGSDPASVVYDGIKKLLRIIMI